MKTAISKRFLCAALALVLCFGIVGSHGVATKVNAADEDGWALTTLAEVNDGDVVLLGMNAHGGQYVMHNGNGTSKAPAATLLATSDVPDVATITLEDYGWTVTKSTVSEKTAYKFTKYGSNDCLYTTATNNGVRVGSNANNTFWLDEKYQMLQNTATSRFLGVYKTTPDWRCYTTADGTNIKGQTLVVWKWTGTITPPETPDPEPELEKATVADGTYYIATADGSKYMSSTVNSNNYHNEVLAADAGNAEIWNFKTVDGVTTITPYGSDAALGLKSYVRYMVTVDTVTTDWTIYQAEGGYYLSITRSGTQYFMEHSTEYSNWDVSETKQVVQLIPATPATADSMSLTIAGHSLVLDDRLEIRYSLDLSDVDVNSVELSGYEIWDCALGEAVPADSTAITTVSGADLTGFRTSSNGTRYYVSHGSGEDGWIIAKDIPNQYYIRAFVVINGEYVYTAAEEYSVYAYWFLVNDQIEAGATTIGVFDAAKLNTTIEALITYGEAAKALYAPAE